MHEFDLIANYFTPLAAPECNNLTNDGAIIPVPGGKQLVVTTDTIISGVHFLPDSHPAHIAQKALRVNLSDLAAMGAIPHRYSLALSLPKDTDETWLGAFCEGLHHDQKSFDIALSGGDTTATEGPLTVTISMIGLVDDTPLMRSGAQAGDDVYVTGTMGDAALGLIHRGNDTLFQRYLLPQPRIDVGTKLHGIASACLDISDGLLQDANHIANASGVRLQINTAYLPLSDSARALFHQDGSVIETILSGGDDYELCFTASPIHRSTIESLKTGVMLTRIGHVESGAAITVIDLDGTPLAINQSGYRHF